MIDNLLWNKITSFEQLKLSYIKCCKGLTHKDSVAWAMHRIDEKTYYLRESILNGTYKIAPYAKVVITFPKYRIAKATKLKDRAFQRSIVDNYFYHEITRHFIYANCACQTGKGTDFARNLLKKYLISARSKWNTTQIYALKCDIKSFFDSIDHNVLKQLLEKYVQDDNVRTEIFRVIDSFDTDKGLGLGSQISQLCALSYLDPIDHFIKDKLKIKYYVRYMDDFILLHNDKQYLRQCLELIKEQLKKLKISINTKKTQIYKLNSYLVTFLGFKFGYSETDKIKQILPKQNVYIERRRLSHQMSFYAEKGVLTFQKINDAFSSWRNHARKGTNNKVIYNTSKYFQQLCYKYKIQKDTTNMTKYYCFHKYNDIDMYGEKHITIKKGTEVFCENNILFYNDLTICLCNSYDSHRHFCLNEDGNGIERGQLIENINNSLKTRYNNAINKKYPSSLQRWNNTYIRLINNVIVQKYLKNTGANNIYWNNNYYSAPITDLQEIKNLLK